MENNPIQKTGFSPGGPRLFLTHFAIGIFGGLVAVYAPKTLSIGTSAVLAIDGEFIRALFNPTFFLFALVLAAVIALIVALKEYGKEKHPFEIFQTALVIPTMLSSLLGYSMESASHIKTLEELEKSKNGRKTHQLEIAPSDLKRVSALESGGDGQPGAHGWSRFLLPARAWAQTSEAADSIHTCLTRSTIKFQLKNFSVQSAQEVKPEDFAVILDTQTTKEAAVQRVKELSQRMDIRIAPFQNGARFILIACGDLMTEAEALSMAEEWGRKFKLTPTVFRLKPEA